MKTKIISFYSDTNGSYYKDNADKLIQVCKKFEISHHIVHLPSKGSYMLNCLQKPNFIKETMKNHNENLIWLDCDTTLHKPFDNFDNITQDIGFTSHTGNMDGIKASPIFFKNGNNFDYIINSWIQACEQGLQKNHYELDHDALKHEVLPKIYRDISIFIIDKNYNDYCNGSIINNGNSRSPEKSIVHRHLNDINKRRPAL